MLLPESFDRDAVFPIDSRLGFQNEVLVPGNQMTSTRENGPISAGLEIQSSRTPPPGRELVV